MTVTVTKNRQGEIKITPEVSISCSTIRELLDPSERRRFPRYGHITPTVIAHYNHISLERWSQILTIAATASETAAQRIDNELPECIVALQGTLYKMFPIRITSPKAQALSAMRQSIIDMTRVECDSMRNEAQNDIAQRYEAVRKKEAELASTARKCKQVYWLGDWRINESSTFFSLSINPRIDHVIHNGRKASIPPISFKTRFWVKILDSTGRYDFEHSYCEKVHPHSGSGSTCLQFPRALPKTIATVENQLRLVSMINAGLTGINYDSLLRSRDWDSSLAQYDPSKRTFREIFADLTFEAEGATFETARIR